MDFPKAQMIAVNGIELEVFSVMPANANPKPIMLCHGWPEHAYSWRYQIEPLVAAGYHVIVPNQRGYGNSGRPDQVTEYDITNLTGDLAALLDHYGYDDALFVGHDWGAIVVWNMAMLHRSRVRGVINLSVPFMHRGSREWVGLWEEALGEDFYIVHFNRQPGVADQAFADNTDNFLRNLYRTEQWQHPPTELPGMPMIAMCNGPEMPGRLMMSEEELAVFKNAFDHSGFTGGINWYRNFSRNWEILADYEQYIHQPTLMIYGNYDMVPKSETLADVVGNLTVHDLPCGHWIQQEQPEQTNALILGWVAEHYPA